MKLNEYIKGVYGLSHSEFERLPNNIQKSIRAEHTSYLSLLNKFKSSEKLIQSYIESKNWFEVEIK